MQAAWQSAVPDIWLGTDGVLSIMINIEAGQIEGLYLANQMLLQDMFIQTASVMGLQLWGTMLGIPQGAGSTAVGSLLWAGEGGTYVDIGSMAALDPGAGGDLLYFITTQDGTIPNPGVPSAPILTDAGTSGNLSGLFQYGVSFLTAAGETAMGTPSNAVNLTAHQASLTAIALGGPGTTSRRIYRSQNGGPYQFLTTILDNTTTTYTDNILNTGSGLPNLISSAEQILVSAQAEQPGASYNAVPGAISIPAQAPAGVTFVTNPNAFAGGSDPQTVDSYRSQLLGWVRGPQTGAPQDLINWALTVDGVEQATVFPNMNGTSSAPGYATVLIGGPGGSIPTSSVVTAVQQVLASKTLGNITIVVSTYTGVSQNVTVTIYPAAGYLTANLTPSVQQAVSNYINSIPAGGIMYLSGIIAVVVALSGILDATVTSPGGNVTFTSQNKPVAGTVTVNGTP